ncbi:MAG: EamA family transporter [Pirellula sp.]
MKNRGDSQGPSEVGLAQGPSFLAIGLALLVLYIVWGSTYLAIRVGVQTFPPFLMGSVRFAVAGAILLGFLQVFRGVRLSLRECVDNAIGGFFMLLGGNGLVSWACQEIPSGIATLVVALNPLFFVGAEWLLGAWTEHRQDAQQSSEALEVAEPSSLSSVVLARMPNGWTQLGLIVGFLGLCILVAPSLSGSGSDELSLARILALVWACLNWTIGSMYIRHVHHACDPMAGASVQMLAGGVFMLLASYLLGEFQGFHWGQIAPEAWWSWGYLVLAGSLVGYTSFVWLMKHASPTLVSTYGYINPMIAVFLGWWILGEQVGPRVMLASATIVAGVAMISWSKR